MKKIILFSLVAFIFCGCFLSVDPYAFSEKNELIQQDTDKESNPAPENVDSSCQTSENESFAEWCSRMYNGFKGLYLWLRLGMPGMSGC